MAHLHKFALPVALIFYYLTEAIQANTPLSLMNLFTFSVTDQNRGLLILRVGLGIMMMAHGYPKLMGGPEKWELVGGAMQHFGLAGGFLFFGLLASLAEFVGGALLVLGLFTRVTCFLLLCTMVVAAFRHYSAGNGFGGWSHAAELAIVFLGLIWIGPGKLSLDYRWFGHKSELKSKYIS